MAYDDFAAALDRFAAGRHYREATVAKWKALAPADAGTLLELAEDLRLGENQLRDLWEWAEAIAAREESSLEQVLRAAPLPAIRRRAIGRSERLKLIKAALRRRRFPQLTATETRLAELVRALRLPATVRVTLPEFLDGQSLHLAIVADSPAAIQDAATALHDAAAQPACEALFRLLREAQ